MMNGAEPIFIEGNEVGILVSHGFTGTTQSMKPLIDAYSETGYTVACPRLEGHGTTPEDMEDSNKDDWIQSVETAYQWLEERCSILFVVGLSMGGTLALYLAERYKQISGVISINGAVDIPAMENVMESAEERFVAAIGSDIKKENVEELAYDRTPVNAIRSLMALMKEVHEGLANIHCPALFFVSDEDHVVPPDNSETIFDSVFSEHKELVRLENSHHVATLDNDQDLIIERSLEFFQTYAKTL
ncbi:alpha/beta fold hydrolase [Halobacillus shinanisalinarum]|uniref:Alpha/beta fold hydrolase n=1 Tax=Halobacillus shinanisalinarum TaxID=2932258 RepID=A0ABY4H1U2_9BACI|nr:alpha/beta fold hydrolase [Halobacillus shinanisalinarum]UOQ92947.1 alpha/beta fold hydrolase [Halobacillus shinanisalinarum]